MLKQINFLNIEKMIEEANIILIYKINWLTLRYLQLLITKNIIWFIIIYDSKKNSLWKDLTQTTSKTLFVEGLRLYKNLPKISPAVPVYLKKLIIIIIKLFFFFYNRLSFIKIIVDIIGTK